MLFKSKNLLLCHLALETMHITLHCEMLGRLLVATVLFLVVY